MTTRVTRRFHSPLAALAEPWQGQAEMVFASAAVARRPDDGSLLTLLRPARDLVPSGVVLPPGIELPGHGDDVVVEQRALRFSGQCIGLSGPGSSLGLPLTASSLSQEALTRHLGELPLTDRTRALLGGVNSGRGFDGRLLEQVGRSLGELCRQVVAEDLDGLERPVAGLAGLGPGLTPTGDDVLVGVAAAAHRLALAGCLPLQRLAALCHALEGLPDGTTTVVSREMLRHAAGGCYPEPLVRVLATLGSDQVDEVAFAELVEQLAAVGSWSGQDMLAGTLSLAQEWVAVEEGVWQ
jgi:hypothetical protein